MRIAVILPSLRAGGAERVASCLANYWSDTGWKVHLVLLTSEREVSYYALQPSIHVHALDLLSRSEGIMQAAVTNLRRIYRLRVQLQAIRPHLILSFFSEAGALAVLAAAGTGVPVVVSERCSPADEPLAPPWRLARWAAFNTAASVVFQTERARDFFSKGIRRRSTVIPNPVRLPATEPSEPLEHTIVAAGRLVHQKGFDILLHAFAAVSSANPTWRLVIYGEGPERQSLEELARELRIAHAVCLPGNSTVPGAWLGSAGIFVLPSRYEGFPNVLCEAMAHGKAVVAADCRYGPREIVNNDVDGLLVPPSDPTALAAALQMLMRSEDRRRKLSGAARQAVTRYAHASVFAQWHDLLVRVAAARHT